LSAPEAVSCHYLESNKAADVSQGRLRCERVGTPPVSRTPSLWFEATSSGPLCGAWRDIRDLNSGEQGEGLSGVRYLNVPKSCRCARRLGNVRQRRVGRVRIEQTTPKRMVYSHPEPPGSSDP
jgi:hypothetical protein